MEQQEKHIHHNLIERAKVFDRKAQSELYRNYSKAMYNTSLRIVADSYLAEDVMQDAFIDAFRKIQDLRDNRQFGPWLKRMVINQSINQVNRAKRLTEKLEEINWDEPIEEVGVDLELEVKQVKQAIQQLARQYQVICSLYLFEGYDHEEIADILKISASASRSHFSRAKKQIIQLIEEVKEKDYETKRK